MGYIMFLVGLSICCALDTGFAAQCALDTALDTALAKSCLQRRRRRRHFRTCCCRPTLLLSQLDSMQPRGGPTTRRAVLVALVFSCLRSCATLKDFPVLTQHACLEPSLPSGQFHVVIAAWKYSNVPCFNDYIWDLGITNANVYVNRRTLANISLRAWTGPCGIKVTEKLLLPNHGLDAAAFYDYLLEHYTSPPLAAVFLHGHGPIAGHTSCQAVFSRVQLYYSMLSHQPDLLFEAITLTSSYDGSGDVHLWNSVSNAGLFPEKMEDFGARSGTDPQIMAACSTILSNWGVDFSRVYFKNVTGFQSCCASFILPRHQILRYPVGLYASIRNFVMAEAFEAASARVCFELIVWGLFGPVEKSVVDPFYQTSHEALPMLMSRMDRCLHSKCNA